jgi:hypothetical protein
MLESRRTYGRHIGGIAQEQYSTVLIQGFRKYDDANQRERLPRSVVGL